MNRGRIRQPVSGAGGRRAPYFDGDCIGQYAEGIFVGGVIAQINCQRWLFAQVTVDPAYGRSLVPVRARHDLKNLPARIHAK